MRQLIDITMALGPRTPLYPGDPAPRAELLTSIAAGDALTASLLHLPVHAGTHVDLPAHFIADGQALGDYPIERFVGPAWVLDLSDVETAITRQRLAAETIPGERHILVKTGNSRRLAEPCFCPDYVHFVPDAIEHLLRLRPSSLGFDYYSLDAPDAAAFPAHRRCAEAGLPVFVCLDLTRCPAGSCWFAGLPLAMPTLEGAPVRAIVWHDEP